MDWLRQMGLTIGLLAFGGSLAHAQGEISPGSDAPPRVALADPAAIQEPGPTTPSSPPATRPAPPSPATPVPANPTTPSATALATPTPPPIIPTPATPSLVGSGLFNQENSAFQDLAGTRPSRTVEFLGDAFGQLANRPPIPTPPPPLPTPNPPPGPIGNGGRGTLPRGAVLLPSVRGFKIAEGQTPRPVDRVYYFTNYFNNVNQQINREYHSPINSIMAYRHTLGFEKTFMDGQASFGAQLPINTLSVNDRNRHGGTTTSVGDLSLIGKYAFLTDPKTGSLFSGGVALTIPTGPSYFAANRAVTNLHYASISPYLGYIWARDRFFFQGFNSVSVPTSSRDVTYLYSDFGIGYYVYRSDNPKNWLSAVVPTLELHVNTPLNHRGGYLRDPAGSADVVDFTYGLNAFFYEKTKASIGLVTPITGPRPFSFEVLANLSYRF